MVFGAATALVWTRASKQGWFGFLGVWFLMLLAPSSSFIPSTTEIAATMGQKILFSKRASGMF